MPVRLFCAVGLAAALSLAACADDASDPVADPPRRSPVGSAGPAPAPPAPEPEPTQADVADGPHEVALIADLGPLPEGGRAVVETTWTTDADGTVRLAIDTPAGLADQHVFTEEEHWWWFSPQVRRTVADAEWVRFDLDAVARAGGELPDIVLAARRHPPRPRDVAVGHVVAGREVLAVESVDHDEVRLTVAGIEQPVVLAQRALPEETVVEIPSGAVDAADVPSVLRW